MKSCLSGLLIVFAAHIAIAQKSPSKFGDIPKEDLSMKIYSGDSSAVAVYLLDFGKSYVTFTATSAVLNFDRHFRIKILKKEGLTPGGPADIRIPLWKVGQDEEKVISLKAVTYTLENGAVVETKLSKEGIFKERVNKNVFLQTFTLPNVKEGSVIEVSYTVMSDFIWNFHNWQFQYRIPVKHSEYWALFPDFFFFEKYMQGYLSTSNYEVKPQNGANFQVQAHHWSCDDVPAFKKEPFMTCEEDYVSKINFALAQISFPGRTIQNVMESWATLNNTLVDHEIFGKVITGSNFLKKKAQEVTAGIEDPQKKVQAIYNYVKESMEWDGSLEKYPDDLKAAFESKKGSSADVNFALASMLEKVDIPVEMVLLSTRDHGFVREQYPMERQLNYVICMAQLGDKFMLLDATDPYLPMETLPQRCLNGRGMVVSKTRHRWIDIEPKTKSKTFVSADLAMATDASLQGLITYSYEGYHAQEQRQQYFEKGETDYLKNFLGEKNWAVEKSEFENIKETSRASKQKHVVTIAEHATVAGDVIYLNPILAEQLKENIFKDEDRMYPVDFEYPHERTFMAKIRIPEGYVIDEMPKPMVIMMPGNACRYTYNLTVTGNMISLVSIFQINKSLYIQQEYGHLREFYNQVVAKQAEQIVLKKTK